MIVFPESIIPRWTEATDLFWKPTLSALASSGKTVLIGTGISIDRSKKYENAIIIRGAQNAVFVQRIPVPIGMWNPFSNRGATLNLKGPNAITLGHYQVVPLICYEQLLTWPAMGSMILRPDVLIGISNHQWAAGTHIPHIQEKMFLAWIRLFRVPYVMATNR